MKKILLTTCAFSSVLLSGCSSDSPSGKSSMLGNLNQSRSVEMKDQVLLGLEKQIQDIQNDMVKIEGLEDRLGVIAFSLSSGSPKSGNSSVASTPTTVAANASFASSGSFDSKAKPTLEQLFDSSSSITELTDSMREADAVTAEIGALSKGVTEKVAGLAKAFEGFKDKEQGESSLLATTIKNITDVAAAFVQDVNTRSANSLKDFADVKDRSAATALLKLFNTARRALTKTLDDSVSRAANLAATKREEFLKAMTEDSLADSGIPVDILRKFDTLTSEAVTDLKKHLAEMYKTLSDTSSQQTLGASGVNLLRSFNLEGRFLPNAYGATLSLNSAAVKNAWLNTRYTPDTDGKSAFMQNILKQVDDGLTLKIKVVKSDSKLTNLLSSSSVTVKASAFANAVLDTSGDYKAAYEAKIKPLVGDLANQGYYVEGFNPEGPDMRESWNAAASGLSTFFNQAKAYVEAATNPIAKIPAEIGNQIAAAQAQAIQDAQAGANAPVTQLGSDIVFTRFTRGASMVDASQLRVNGVNGSSVATDSPFTLKLNGDVSDNLSGYVSGAAAYKLGSLSIGSVFSHNNTAVKQQEASLLVSNTFGSVFVEGQIGAVFLEDSKALRTQVALGIDTKYVSPFVQLSQNSVDGRSSVIPFVGLETDVVTLNTEGGELSNSLAVKTDVHGNSYASWASKLSLTSGCSMSGQLEGGVHDISTSVSIGLEK